MFYKQASACFGVKQTNKKEQLWTVQNAEMFEAGFYFQHCETVC